LRHPALAVARGQPAEQSRHVVGTANEAAPETVMDQFKAWCSRRLNERGVRRKHWWTRHGSTKWINDEEYLHNAINYVVNRQ
jgi:hypothetical protein